MELKEYEMFLYGYNKIDGYSIVSKKKVEIPSTFYKYYALTDYFLASKKKLQMPIRLAILSDFNKYEFVPIRILKHAERNF